MNVRMYGEKPYKIAVVHGGPGAAGSMEPVARKLGEKWGVLEPLQTALTVEGQIKELKEAIESHGEGPMTLVGHSWGAMLIYMFAAKHKELVNKIIMVGSGSVEEKYYEDLCENREERLTTEEREELSSLRNKFAKPEEQEDIDAVFKQFGFLMEKLDTYCAIEDISDTTIASFEIFSKVWPMVHGMRKRGELYTMGEFITCPVVAIHGDFDSHPMEGIRDSLQKMIKDFTFYGLEKCGHTPWHEVHAIETFYEILVKEIGCE